MSESGHAAQTAEGVADESGSKGGIGDPNTEWTVVSLVVFAILLFVLVVWLQSVFYRVQRTELEEKVIAQSPEDLALVRAHQEEMLASYRWIDPEKGVVAIPIERAMQLMAAEESGSR